MTTRAGTRSKDVDQGSSRGLPLAGGMDADAPRNRRALRGQRPRVRLALGTDRAVGEQPEALQTRQQLGDLPGVGDPGVLADLAVAGIRSPPTQLGDPFKHTRGAVGQSHLHTAERVDYTLRREPAGAARRARGGLRRRADLLASGRTRALVG